MVNRPSASREFDQMDGNNDGVLDRAEFNAAYPSTSSWASPAHYSPTPAVHYSPAGAAAARHSPTLPAQDHLAINAPLGSFNEHTQADAALKEAQRALLYASELHRSIEQSQSPPRASSKSHSRSRSLETSERPDPGGQQQSRDATGQQPSREASGRSMEAYQNTLALNELEQTLAQALIDRDSYAIQLDEASQQKDAAVANLHVAESSLRVPHAVTLTHLKTAKHSSTATPHSHT